MRESERGRRAHIAGRCRSAPAGQDSDGAQVLPFPRIADAQADVRHVHGGLVPEPQAYTATRGFAANRGQSNSDQAKRLAAGDQRGPVAVEVEWGRSATIRRPAMYPESTGRSQAWQIRAAAGVVIRCSCGTHSPGDVARLSARRS
ncbi:hypothetical protein GCM10023205_79440 [Yinghuangia aomiensis]|uniref:Uncharacterized protein n=1 Tax=Yinghuangia aomiensis TaxID=676205 RepID=A0ABP9ICI8_9ACTN